MSIEWDLPAPFQFEVLVETSHIDGLGHTNNTCYVTWCEQCAWLHSESLGLSVQDYQLLDRGVAIQHADYDYFMPSYPGDRLIVGTWLVGCDGRLRLERRFQVVHQTSGETVMRGHWVLVSMVLSSGRPARLPDRFVHTYGAALVAPADLSAAGFASSLSAVYRKTLR